MGNELDLLRSAVASPTPAALDAWAGTGLAGLETLRDALTRPGALADVEGVHPRDALDNLGEAVAAIAARHPADFLMVFDSPAFADSGFVIRGLGCVDDPRATARLLVAARSPSEWIRMDAAIALGRHPEPQAADALVALLGDAEYLVRYHALRSLATAGDERCLPALRSFIPSNEPERTAATHAIDEIERRAAATRQARARTGRTTAR